MKKMNNKGFSLVELIIVIAIMAILIAVLAPQYIKYVEKSRQSADLDNYQAIINAVQTAYADEDMAASLGSTGTITFAKNTGVATTVTSLDSALQQLGVSLGNIKTKSSLYGAATLSIGNNNGVVTISLTSGAASLKEKLGLK